MKRPVGDENRISGLDNLALLGSDKIACALSRWLGIKIYPRHPRASIDHYSKLADITSSPEEPVTAILVKVSGDIDGYLLFLFDEKSSLEIVKRLLPRNRGSNFVWDDLTKSAMEETGNIIGTAFLNAVAGSLGLEIYPSSPVTAFDISSAIIETVMTHLASHGEHYLSFRASFYSEMNVINGTFAMIPDDTCILEYI